MRRKTSIRITKDSSPPTLIRTSRISFLVFGVRWLRQAKIPHMSSAIQILIVIEDFFTSELWIILQRHIFRLAHCFAPPRFECDCLREKHYSAPCSFIFVCTFTIFQCTQMQITFQGSLYYYVLLNALCCHHVDHTINCVENTRGGKTSKTSMEPNNCVKPSM